MTSCLLCTVVGDCSTFGFAVFKINPLTLAVNAITCFRNTNVNNAYISILTFKLTACFWIFDRS